MLKLHRTYQEKTSSQHRKYFLLYFCSPIETPRCRAMEKQILRNRDEFDGFQHGISHKKRTSINA
jgi:hypothetical protein